MCQRAIREYLAKLKAIADKAKQEAYEKEMAQLQHGTTTAPSALAQAGPGPGRTRLKP